MMSLLVLCMSVGLIFFTLADSKVQPEFDLLGVWLVCCALVADAVIGNVQEKALKEYKPSNSEMVRYLPNISSAKRTLFRYFSHIQLVLFIYLHLI